jgi:hypothetical protein
MGFDEVTYALLKKMIGRGSSDEQGSFIPSYGVIGSIALGTSWSGNDPYTQTVTLTGYTPTNGTMVSVLPDTSVLTQMASDGINEIFITNNNGTLTATAIGGRSTAAMTLYVLCSETDVAETINGLSVDVSDLKNAISELEDQVVTDVTVTGTVVTIVAQANKRYLCGTVSTIDVTPCATGAFDLIFTSGTTAAVLTIPNTVKWQDDTFNPTALDTSTTYEISVADGTLGLVAKWT